MTLAGLNILLEGATGTGKTHSIGTLVEADPKLDVHYFAFENGAESLIGYFTDRGKPVPPNLHISTVAPAQAGWSQMADNVKNVNTLPYKLLKDMVDPNRSQYNQLEKFLRSFNDVTSDDGRKWGSVDSWGTNKALVMDGHTGFCVAVLKAVCGGKADRDQKDWGLAQNIAEDFLRRLCDNCRCHFMMLAHIERETDPVLGGSKITISSLGKALPPKIPPMFSDVILAKRAGKEFLWDTEDPGADLKSRNLPISSKLPPDFGQLIAKWKSRGGVIGG